MEVIEKVKKMPKDKKMLIAVTVLGMSGLILIMLSSVTPDKAKTKTANVKVAADISADFCNETEKRLENFLRSVEGAGDVRVYLTVGSSERYIYATEGRKSKSDERTEVDEQYVIVGNASDKTALIETVETPEIVGAVIACTGCGNPVVEERMYKAASAALGIPTGKIYVTRLE